MLLKTLHPIASSTWNKSQLFGGGGGGSTTGLK